jgi:hypothetical protein
VEGNLERALSEEPCPGARRKLTGKEEALLVATPCTNPPEGRARWTLELLADAMVKLTEHESLSGETVRRRLAENGLKPWRRETPPEPASNGCSQPTKPAPKWATPIPTHPKSHNHCVEVLSRY